MTLVSKLIPISSDSPGDLRYYAGLVPISGEAVIDGQFLVANNALVSRITYPALFAECGFAYSPTPGTDPGGSQFYLPGYTDGRNFISRGASRYPTRGVKGGAQRVALASDGSQDAPHVHTQGNSVGYSGPTGATGPHSGAQPSPAGFPYPYGVSGGGGGDGRTTGASTGIANRSGNAPNSHQNMPPIQVVGGVLIKF